MKVITLGIALALLLWILVWIITGPFRLLYFGATALLNEACRNYFIGHPRD